MGISTLTFADQCNGRMFATWVDELVYSAGRYADFASLDLPTSDEIVLSLACLPESLAGAAKAGTRHRRSDKEFWSTVHANYDEFTSDNPIAKIDCISAALVKAIEQLPQTRMPNPTKVQVLTAISAGANDLRNEPLRHPR